MTAPIIENNYTGDGSTVLFSFTFEYIEATDIEVSIDAVTVATTSYSLANSTTIEFNTAPASGAAIRVYRNTTVNNPKATFFPGSAIRAQDLNDNFEQILFVTQEADAISERAEDAADQAQIATAAAQTASASATAAASQAQTQVNASAASAASAAADAAQASTDAANAVSTANTANTTANTASTNAAAAAANASAAATSAAAAATDAASAQTSAINAQTSAANALSQSATAQTAATTAQTAATNAAASSTVATNNASAAVTTANAASATANTASTDASTALTAANNAVSTANSASSTANTASTDASAAVTTANTAASDASTAVSTANTANTTANTAITNAATAQTTANSAVTTANAASTTANNASSLATTTAAAVANAYLFNNVAAVANIPSSPSDGDAVRVVNSTNIESTSSVQGVPSGFVGDSGINVEIIYSSSASKWNYIAYNANDPDDRYGYPPYVDVTRQNTVDAATLSGRPLNSTHLGTFTGSTIADSSTVKAALQNLETEVETKADLVGGVVPTSQLPALAITTFLGTVANQTAMLALSGQRGDFAIRTDTGSTFVLTSDGGSTLSDWQELETPTDAIQTVNGQTGTVVLGPSDVSAVSATSGGTFSGNVEIGTGIDLNTNGSATFAGNVSSGTPSEDGSTAGSKLGSNGKIVAARSGAGNQIFEGYLIGDSSPNVVISNDGSATFGSEVTVSGRIQSSGTSAKLEVSRNGTGNSTDTALDVQDLGGRKAAIFTDGSASFAGDVEITSAASDSPGAASSDQVFSVQNGAVDYVKVRAQGAGSGGPGGSGGNLVFSHRGDNTGAFVDRTVFGYDGSATFAGSITISNYNTSANANGISLKSTGQVEAQCDSLQADTFRLFRGTRSTTEVFNVKADGSADFASVASTSRTRGIVSYADNSNPNNKSFAIYNVDNGSYPFYVEADGLASFAGSITAAGNVTAFSDIRLKKDIELIPNALDKVLSLRGITFTDIASDERRTGVIAQEVQAVLPEAVKEGEEYLSVAYGNLVGVLIESIKELEARVRELEGR